MARSRMLNMIGVGEYIATVFWSHGKGIEERTRFAEQIGVKVTDTWVYIYLRDGDEIIKLSRKRNTSAQVYINMTLRDVMRERTLNHIHNSTSCCYAGERRDNVTFSGLKCAIHTDAWIEAHIDSRIGELVTDNDWPAVLAQRKIEAARAEEFLAQRALEREQAKAQGFGEWRKLNGHWMIAVADHVQGDVVTVRRRSGALSMHKLGRQYSPNVFRDDGLVTESKQEVA